jgi:hypothetical protein
LGHKLEGFGSESLSIQGNNGEKSFGNYRSAKELAVNLSVVLYCISQKAGNPHGANLRGAHRQKIFEICWKSIGQPCLVAIRRIRIDRMY